MSVTVQTRDFVKGSWTCPTCGRSCNDDRQTRQGRQVYRCQVCNQEITREGDAWKTLNRIVRDNARPGDQYREIPVDGTFAPVSVSIQETPRTEKWSWRCPKCQHTNEAGPGLQPSGPLREIRDGKSNILLGIFLKCWSCLLVIQQDPAGAWSVLEGGAS